MTGPIEHLHATKASDAVDDVNNQVAVVEFEKAIDRSRFDAPAWQCGALLPGRQLFPVE